jgi:hypothetical protein
MAGSNWQQLAGGSVNPYDIRRDDGTLTADYGEHIISDGGTVTLPSPKGDEAVLVSNISQDTTVTTSTGLVEQQSDVTHSSTTSGPVLFVSDGSDWYVANNLDYISTIPDGTVDNFNDAGNGGIYESGDSLATFYSGDTGAFNRVASDLSGGKMLDATTGNVELISTPGDGLNAYPAKGDTFACTVRVQTQAAPRLRYGLADSNNFYMVEIKSDGSVTLFKKESGSFSTLDSGSITVSDGDEFDIEIQWGSDDSHTVDIYPFDPTNNSRGTSAATLTEASDATFANNSGVGYRQGGDSNPATNCEWDQFRITS